MAQGKTLTPPHPYTIMHSYLVPMKIHATLTLVLVAGWLAAAPPEWAQASSASRPPTLQNPAEQGSQADAYFYFAQGHLEELQYELTSDAQSATQSIESYKRALAIDPNSAVIKERLAEIYAKSQHIRDAVVQAQEALQVDPKNVDAHRLLA